MIKYYFKKYTKVHCIILFWFILIEFNKHGLNVGARVSKRLYRYMFDVGFRPFDVTVFDKKGSVKFIYPHRFTRAG